MYNTDMPNRADLPTTRQLIRSTLIAIVTAGMLLVTVVLPAEYAVDPSGIGRVLGLTEMGEIKQQLAEEAAADAASTTAPPSQAPVEATAPPEAETLASAPETERPGPAWRDEIVLTLAPGEAAEIKLVMNAGKTAGYEWIADQGHVNSDLHGDGAARQSTSYRKGRAEASDSGQLTAAFDGSHGWFWRNRSDVAVTLILRVNGAYDEIKRVI